MNDVVQAALESEREAVESASSAIIAEAAAETAQEASAAAVATAHNVAAVAELTAAQIIAQNDARMSDLEAGLNECRNMLTMERAEQSTILARLDAMQAGLSSLIQPPEIVVVPEAEIIPETIPEVQPAAVAEEQPTEPEKPRHRIRRL